MAVRMEEEVLGLEAREEDRHRLEVLEVGVAVSSLERLGKVEVKVPEGWKGQRREER
jgi:hypothetical protein